MAKATRKNRPKTTPHHEVQQKKEKKALLLPVAVAFFVLLWAWAALWYGDVFRMAREYSFWSPDKTLMYFMEGRPWGALWKAGLFLLQFYRWPVLGGLITAFFVSGSTWLIGYCLRLRGWWRLLQYIPAAAYLVYVTYLGFDLYYETETGQIMGIPLLAFSLLLLLAFIIRSFAKGHTFPHILLPPTDETPWQNRVQMFICVAIVGLAMLVSQTMRPYVRVTTRMQCQMMEQDWRGMIETAHKSPELSYRQIAAYYAIALVHTNELGSKLFDIRLDYDEPYIHGFNGEETNGANYYMMDCDFTAGLIQTAIHHAMEHMTMNGPNLRALKTLTKCALMKSEWKVAEKYLDVLEHVPFESEFVEKYRPMLYDSEKVNNDAEMKAVRLTEPLHDSFENFYIQPTFLGYTAALTEGRSLNALWNSLVVHIYTKTMPQFIERCAPIRGTTPPRNISEALFLMSGKYPQISQSFPMLGYNQGRMASFMTEVKPYMGSHETRAAHARELFPKYKGYYPYYYFFGNLKATRRKDVTQEGSSNQGVN